MYTLSNCSSYPEQQQFAVVDLPHIFVEIVLVIIVLLATVAKKLRCRNLKTDVSDASTASPSPAAETSCQIAGSPKKEFYKNCRQTIG